MHHHKALDRLVQNQGSVGTVLLRLHSALRWHCSPDKQCKDTALLTNIHFTMGTLSYEINGLLGRALADFWMPSTLSVCVPIHSTADGAVMSAILMPLTEVLEDDCTFLIALHWRGVQHICTECRRTGKQPRQGSVGPGGSSAQ